MALNTANTGAKKSGRLTLGDLRSVFVYVTLVCAAPGSISRAADDRIRARTFGPPPARDLMPRPLIVAVPASRLESTQEKIRVVIVSTRERVSACEAHKIRLGLPLSLSSRASLGSPPSQLPLNQAS